GRERASQPDGVVGKAGLSAAPPNLLGKEGVVSLQPLARAWYWVPTHAAGGCNCFYATPHEQTYRGAEQQFTRT
ncbi:MAG: hypothetical protein DMG29_01500, partial [Acidobacteria bacterium]